MTQDYRVFFHLSIEIIISQTSVHLSLFLSWFRIVKRVGKAKGHRLHTKISQQNMSMQGFRISKVLNRRKSLGWTYNRYNRDLKSSILRLNITMSTTSKAPHIPFGLNKSHQTNRWCNLIYDPFPFTSQLSHRLRTTQTQTWRFSNTMSKAPGENTPVFSSPKISQSYCHLFLS